MTVLPGTLPFTPDTPVGTAAIGAEISPTDETLAAAAAMPPADMIDITVELTDPAPELPVMTRLTQTQRDAEVASREQALNSSQQPLITHLNGIGAQAITPLWIINAVQTTVKAGDVPGIAALPNVVELSLNDDDIIPEDVAGRAMRAGPRGQDFLDDGFDGSSGTARIAILERTNVMRAHEAFLTPGGAERLDVRNCNACTSSFIFCFRWGCRPSGAASTVNTHGTDMAFYAMGSIEDPPGAGTNAEQDRSGIYPATDADEVLYYRFNDTDALARAIQHAVGRGVVAANLSQGLGNGCSRRRNRSGLNRTLRNALRSGTVVVKSSGNSPTDIATTATSPGCTLTYPAQRPHVLTVGGLEGGGYDSAQRWLSDQPIGGPAFRGSARGPVQVRYQGGSLLPAASVAVANYAEAQFQATGLPDVVIAPPYDVDGTSIAAALTTGLVGQLNEALTPGWTTGDGRAVLLHLFVTADAFSLEAGGDRNARISTGTGFGRVKLHRPFADLGTVWGWGWRTFRASPGVHKWTVWDSGAENPAVNQWKWAVAAFPDGINDINFRWFIAAVDTCSTSSIPAFGGELVSIDLSGDYRKAIHLTEDEVCPPGNPTCRCLEMQLWVLDAPSGGGRIWSADYFHSANPADH